ncbi:hypothetical protein TNCV_668431 [Trichonephila clavipes]|nr:hypothetical protein TNCV_668431 [Trichonephila clavipes]
MLLFGREISKNRVSAETVSMLRGGNTRPLPGHISIGSISVKQNFVLACLHPAWSPTREAVCRSTDNSQSRRLPGVYPEYSATASGRGSDGKKLFGLDTIKNICLRSGHEKKKRKSGMTRKRVENREGSLGYPGFVKPVFTKDSKPLEKRK